MKEINKLYVLHDFIEWLIEHGYEEVNASNIEEYLGCGFYCMDTEDIEELMHASKEETADVLNEFFLHLSSKR